LHCRNSYYYRQREDRLNKIENMKCLDHKKFILYSSNLLFKPDIFDKETSTTISMDTYSNMFSNSNSENSNTYNATEGGIGISGLKNISLREAINLYCTINISAQVDTILKSIQLVSSDTNQIIQAAEKQLAFFTKLSYLLNKIGNNLIKDNQFTRQNKVEFVQNMELMIQYLLKNEEATLLLQGYDYSGFSNWNQKATTIMNRKNSAEKNQLLEEEFLRDREFFQVLKGAVEFNMEVFKDFTNENLINKSTHPR
jgi:hypothetical protein